MTACPSCHTTDTKLIGPLTAAMTFAGQMLEAPLPGGQLFACTQCHLWFRFPVPPQAQLDALYQQAETTHWHYHPFKRHDWHLTRRFLSQHDQGNTILDVGCFDGAFLDTLPPTWNRFGVEINPSAAQEAARRGITLLGSDLHELSHKVLHFDAVCAFNVIEHVTAPLDFLRDLAIRTAPGGLIFIASGNTQAWSWHMMKHRYWYCAIPEHLVFIGDAWCQWAARQLELDLLQLAHFAHEASWKPTQMAREAATNFLHWAAPPLSRTLRRAGMGDKPAARFPELADYPPSWMTARDHVLAIFRKR